MLTTQNYNVPASAVDDLPSAAAAWMLWAAPTRGILLGASQSPGGTVFSLGPMGSTQRGERTDSSIAGGPVYFPEDARLGVNGNQAGQTFTVTYTDGTTASFAAGYQRLVHTAKLSWRIEAVTTSLP